MAGLGSQFSVLTSHPLTVPLIKSLFQFVLCRVLEVPWRCLGSCRGDVEVPGKRALPSSSTREALFLMTTYTGLLGKFNMNSVSTWKKKVYKIFENHCTKIMLLIAFLAFSHVLPCLTLIILL